jgi:hypothetical protein
MVLRNHDAKRIWGVGVRGARTMMWVMSIGGTSPRGDHAADLMRIYDHAVDEVYRYLRARCGQRRARREFRIVYERQEGGAA